MELNRDLLVEGSSLLITLNKSINDDENRFRRINVKKIISMKNLLNRPIDEVKFVIKNDQALLSNIHSKNDFNNFLMKWYDLELFGNISKKDNFHKLLARRKHNSLKEIKKSLQIFSLGRQENLLPLLNKNETPLLYISGEKDKKYTQIGKLFTKEVPISFHQSVNGASHNTHFVDPKTFEKKVTLFLENDFTF